jgi:FAD/FMN-containing dehydrogenase
MRAKVVGVEAVLGTGAVVSHLGGLLKDNTGYDLAGLLCGSEGTLGIVTSVRLRLVPAAAARVVVLLGLPDVEAALACLVAARRGAPSLEAAELFFADGLELVTSHLGIAPPLPSSSEAYLLLEAAASSDPTDELLTALADVDDRIADTAVASDASRRADLWRYREAHTESINAVGVPHKLDVTLPLAELARFCDEVRAVVVRVAPAAHTYLFGHAGDGNVHVNVVGGEVSDDVDAAVLELVARRGGSISAEHGIGTAKKGYLSLVRSEAELDAFRRLKAAFDPAGVLNPNALVPDPLS